jgi:hypothetical protein
MGNFWGIFRTINIDNQLIMVKVNLFQTMGNFTKQDPVNPKILSVLIQITAQRMGNFWGTF